MAFRTSTRSHGRNAFSVVAVVTLWLMALGAPAGASALSAAPASVPSPTVADVAPATGSCGTVPLDVELIIDHSGSMTGNSDNGQTRAYWAKQAADALIDDLDANGGVGTTSDPTSGRHRVGVTQFSGTTATVVSSLGANNAAGTEALITATGNGNTPFKTGMATGAADLTANKRTTDSLSKLLVSHVIVFLSDGTPNPDSTTGTTPPWTDVTTSQRPTQADGTAFLAAADQIFSIAVGSGGSGSNLVDTALMKALAKPSPDAVHYANIVDSSKLGDFFANIFTTIACPVSGSLEITTTASDGTDFPGGAFAFSVDCGTGGTYPATIDVAPGATTGNATVSGIAQGASCSVTETSTPDAGLGWTWGTPVITGSPATIAAGQTAQVGVSDTRIPLAIASWVIETGYSKVGDVLHYQIIASNGGASSVASVTVSDPSVRDLACTPANGSSLGHEGSMQCTYTHTIIQADLDAGHYANTVCVEGAPATEACASKDIPGTQIRSIGLAKDPSPTSYSAVNDSITYTYTITNTGNVTLGPSQFTVSDDHIWSPLGTAFNCGPAGTTFAPNATVTCTVTYTIVQADIDAGSVTNVATASGAGLTTNPATATVTIARPAIAIAEAASRTGLPIGGGSVTYTYVVTNPGNVPLTGVIVSDLVSGTSRVACVPAGLVMTGGNQDASLDPGETWVYACTRFIARTTTDTATATGHWGTAAVASTDTATVTVGHAPPAPTPPAPAPTPPAPAPTPPAPAPTPPTPITTPTPTPITTPPTLTPPIPTPTPVSPSEPMPMPTPTATPGVAGVPIVGGSTGSDSGGNGTDGSSGSSGPAGDAPAASGPSGGNTGADSTSSLEGSRGGNLGGDDTGSVAPAPSLGGSSPAAAPGDAASGIGVGAAPASVSGTAGGGSFAAEVSNARANGSQRVGPGSLGQAGIPGLPGSDPFGRLGHLVPLASLLSTTTTLALAFLLFGKKRRDEEAPVSDEDLAAAAASPYAKLATDFAPAFAGVDPGTGGTDVNLPRWRRPSLLAARKSDPIRNGTEHVTLTFAAQGGSTTGGERKVVRYRLVQLLDRPDELLGQAVDTLDDGDEVEIVEHRGTYRRVRTPDGRQGWLHRMTLGNVVAEDQSGPRLSPPDEDVLLTYLSAHARR